MAGTDEHKRVGKMLPTSIPGCARLPTEMPLDDDHAWEIAEEPIIAVTVPCGIAALTADSGHLRIGHRQADGVFGDVEESAAIEWRQAREASTLSSPSAWLFPLSGPVDVAVAVAAPKGAVPDRHAKVLAADAVLRGAVTAGVIQSTSTDWVRTMVLFAPWWSNDQPASISVELWASE